MKDLNVKAWYTSTFPTDELGMEMNASVDFGALFEAIKKHIDVYEVLNVHDSIVRERVFDKLSTIMNVEYKYIYDLWLES